MKMAKQWNSLHTKNFIVLEEYLNVNIFSNTKVVVKCKKCKNIGERFEVFI